jgi:hypothetical protein
MTRQPGLPPVVEAFLISPDARAKVLDRLKATDRLDTSVARQSASAGEGVRANPVKGSGHSA